jgi:hypothetical protein
MPVPKRGKSKRRWVGSSKQSKVITIEAAIADAYDLAKPYFKDEPIELKVEDIYVLGNNPITEYRVVLGLPLGG